MHKGILLETINFLKFSCQQSRICVIHWLSDFSGIMKIMTMVTLLKVSVAFRPIILSKLLTPPSWKESKRMYSPKYSHQFTGLGCGEEQTNQNLLHCKFV